MVRIFRSFCRVHMVDIVRRRQAPMYYRGANAALLLYDITNAATFEDVRGWLEGALPRNFDRLPSYLPFSSKPVWYPKYSTELKKNCSSELIIYIVGSKSDLHRQRQVTSDRVRLSLATWFPPPRPPSPPTPPPPQMSSFSYIRPRFTSFTTSRSVPVSSFAPKALDDSSLSRPSELHRSTSAVPRVAAKPETGALRRANSHNPSTSPHRAKLVERALQSSPFGLQSGGFIDDGSSNSGVLEEMDEDDDSSEWGLERGMSLFEVSAKDDHGTSSAGRCSHPTNIGVHSQASRTCSTRSFPPSYNEKKASSAKTSSRNGTPSCSRRRFHHPGLLKRKRKRRLSHRAIPGVAARSSALARIDFRVFFSEKAGKHVRSRHFL